MKGLQFWVKAKKNDQELGKLEKNAQQMVDRFKNWYTKKDKLPELKIAHERWLKTKKKMGSRTIT